MAEETWPEKNKFPQREEGNDIDYGLLTRSEFRYLLFVLGLIVSIMPWWYLINFAGAGDVEYKRYTLLDCLFIENTGLQAAVILYYLGLVTLLFKQVRWLVLGAIFWLISFLVGFYSMVNFYDQLIQYTEMLVLLGGAHLLALFVFLAMLFIIGIRFLEKDMKML
jgi:hypothetical protein